MKDYVKPTIEIMEKQSENSTADTGSNEIEGIYKFLPIHTLSKKITEPMSMLVILINHNGELRCIHKS